MNNKHEIIQKVDELKDELLKMRFQAATGQLEHPHKVKATKNEIARLLTTLNMEQKAGLKNGK